MYRNGIFGAVSRFVPHFFVDLLNGIHTPCVANEQQQDLVFHRRHAHGFAIHRHLFALVIYDQLPCLEHIFLGLHAAQLGIAPQLRFDSRNEFQGVEGLCHIIICADVQAHDLVGVFAFGRQHDHRDVLCFPDLQRGPDAIQPWHHHIHNDQLDRMLLQHFQGLLPIIGFIDLIAFVFQIDLNGIYDLLFIVAHKNVHAFCSFLTVHCYPNSDFFLGL